MKKVKWQTLHDGEWVKLDNRLEYFGCCDCKLVHLVQYKVIKGKIHYRAWRDMRKTAARRRAKGIKITYEK